PPALPPFPTRRSSDLELGPRILPQDEPDAVRWVTDALVRDGVRLRLGARVTGAARTSAGKVLSLADGTAVAADEVLVAAVPDQRDRKSTRLNSSHRTI